MSEANYNPAPWEYENVEQRREQSAYGVVKDANGKILFDSLNSDVAEIHIVPDEAGAHRWDDAARRNLTLAAAAPELLAALEELLEAVPAFRLKPVGYKGSEARQQQEAHIAAEDKARAAITKAKGA